MHELTLGVTVIVPVILAKVSLVGAVHVGILSVPLAKIPIAGLLFIHVYVALEGVLEKVPTSIVLPGQAEMSLTASISGEG